MAAMNAPVQKICLSYVSVHVLILFYGFLGYDVANLAAQYLHEKGIKVWR